MHIGYVVRDLALAYLLINELHAIPRSNDSFSPEPFRLCVWFLHVIKS